ncbi:MAG TPA: hypothetical protein VGN27_14650 [Gaiellaceae bacterium]|nr:hypothetical protein [Gaiellaceae bacterium]
MSRGHMGWRDRDWAKFDEDELRRLYGVVRVPKANPGCPPAQGPDLLGTVRLPSGATRSRIWGGLAVLVLAFGVFAYQHRGTATPPVVALGPPVLYGIRGTDARVDPLVPGGTRTVCTEEGFATGRGWACISWALNVHDVPVVAPPPYQGACTHLIVDTAQPRWTCLGAYPYSPDELPPSAAPASSS